MTFNPMMPAMDRSKYLLHVIVWMKRRRREYRDQYGTSRNPGIDEKKQ